MTRRKATGCGQTPLAAGQGTGKESAQRNSFPGSTLQVQRESAYQAFPKVSNLGNGEMARAPCQEPLASQQTLPVLQLATDKGLQGQDSCPHGPLASNPHPNQGYGRTGRDWMLSKRTSCLGNTSFSPHPEGNLCNRHSLASMTLAMLLAADHRLPQWGFPYETEHSY